MATLFIFDELQRRDIRKQRVFRDRLLDGKINQCLPFHHFLPCSVFPFGGEVGAKFTSYNADAVRNRINKRVYFALCPVQLSRHYGNMSSARQRRRFSRSFQGGNFTHKRKRVPLGLATSKLRFTIYD